MGDDGDGSVDRRMVGGFRRKSDSGEPRVEVAESLKLGRGEGRNSSILSVSGTGSMLAEVRAALGETGLVTGKKGAYGVDGCSVRAVDSRGDGCRRARVRSDKGCKQVPFAVRVEVVIRSVRRNRVGRGWKIHVLESQDPNRSLLMLVTRS